MSKKDKEKRSRSIVFSIIRMSVIPILVLGIVLTFFGQQSVNDAINYEIERSLSGVAHNLISRYNELDAGDFSASEEKILKGETEVTSDYRILDDLKEDTGIDVTVFVGETRRLTTVTNSDGIRAVGTKASQEVVDAVYKNAEEYFSENVNVNGVLYYGYYVPIIGNDESVIGMVFAGRSVEDIKTSVKYTLYGNVLICIFAILLAGFICYLSAAKIVEAIRHIKEFLKKVSKGQFGEEMPESVLKRRDELAQMGEHAIEVSKSLEDLVSRDPLTGLLNRRACMMRVEKLEDEDYVVIMGDIDHFKMVNDTYGHDKGDEALVYMSTRLKEFVNKDGFVVRWGGEEFILIIRKSLEEIKEKLEAFHKTIPYKKIYIDDEDDDGFKITATFGAIQRNAGESFEEVTKKADELLYYGKEHGRNQVVYEDVLQ